MTSLGSELSLPRTGDVVIWRVPVADFEDTLETVRGYGEVTAFAEFPRELDVVLIDRAEEVRAHEAITLEALASLDALEALLLNVQFGILQVTFV